MCAQAALLDLSENPVEFERPEPTLSIQGMSLTLGQRVVLSDVSFGIGRAEIVGLLGPNGSGKSSLMRCLTGLVAPDVGTLWMDGKAVSLANRTLRARLGVVFQDPSLDNKLTCLENLQLGAGLFAVPRNEALKRARELLVFMEIADRAKDLVGTLSGGMRRRLELARALIHQPKILLLDEPTTGLDPIAFERTWQRLLALRRMQGLSILVSTHRAEEAAMCDRVVVLDRGHVIANDSPAAILDRVAGDVITIEADRPQELVDELLNEFELVSHREGDKVIIEREEGHAFIPRLVESFPPGRFRSIALRRPSLADAFFKLTGHNLMSDSGDAK